MAHADDDYLALCANLKMHSAVARKHLALRTDDVDRLSRVEDGTTESIEAGNEPKVTIWDLQRLAITLGLTRHGTPRSSGHPLEEDIC